MTLRVSPARRDVVLTIPKGVGEKKARRFIGQHSEWLRHQLAQLPSAVPFADGAAIPLEGKMHRLVFSGPRKRHEAGRAVVMVRPASGQDEAGDGAGAGVGAGEGETEEMPVIDVMGPCEHAPRRLESWLKKRAGERLRERAAHHARCLGLSFSRIGVRDQATRWGSCSSRGSLSFSWRLIMAPPHVLDYVAAHEVAHLKEMNHSPRFWALVARAVPEYRKARVWLHENGQDLHRYGAKDDKSG